MPDIPTIYGDPLDYIPDDVSIPQFFFDMYHPLGAEAVQLRKPAYFIDDTSGEEVMADQVRMRVAGLANALCMRWNFGNSDVACIYGVNSIDYPIVIWAVLRVGGIVTGANPAYTAAELTSQIKIAKATVLFVHPDSLKVGLEAARMSGVREDHIVILGPMSGATHFTLEDLIAEGLTQPQRWIEPSFKPGEGKTRVAFLMFSSGTTGKPKAVMISHYAVIANCIQMKQYINSRDGALPNEKKLYAAGDVVLGVVPLYHIYGIATALHFFLFCGITIVIVPRFDFTSMLRSIQRYKIAHLPLVPPMVVLLCKHPAVKDYNLESVKMLYSGAAPLSAELIHQVARLLDKSHIGQGYGMTETIVVSFAQLDMRVGTPGSAGRCVHGTAWRILKRDGTWGGYNERGELVVRTPSMALGYLDDPQATAETFKDGWVHTGDEGYINEKHEVFIVDRIKELIKVRGFQVAPAELEGHLLDHPDVADVCVIGARDEYSGELPFAFVSTHEQIRKRIQESPEEARRVRQSILKFVSDHKTQYKWLAGVEFVDVVPKNPSGKLLRRLLRDSLGQLIQEGRIKLVQPGSKKERIKL